MRVVLAALLTAGVSLSATTLGGAAPAASPPGWKVIPGVRAQFGVVALGWASNRAWVSLNVGSDQMRVTSAAISGRGLGAFKAARFNASLQVRVIAGSELVYSVSDSDTGAISLVARQLLESGGLGPPGAVPLDTTKIAPNQFIFPQAAVRVGERTVWALPGGTRAFNPTATFWVCCATDGSARDLTRFIDRASGPRPVRLGLDGRGRLWLAWHDRGGTKVVELDPSSLLPRTSRPIVAPVRVVERFDLACAAACRLVLEGIRTGIYSWAPGERSPTRIARIAKVVGSARAPRLLAAAYRSGRLAVAYVPLNAPYGVRVVRGDARGARPRLVGRLKPTADGSEAVLAHAAFVPAGLVAVTPTIADPGPFPVLIGLIRLPQ